MTRFDLSIGTILLLGITACSDAGESSGLAEGDGLSETDVVCSLESLPALPDVRITSVSAQDAPVPHCAVAGVIGTETNFELLLPDAWNGKFVMGGGGGFVGAVVNTSTGYGVLQSGYATVGTDTGHRGSPLDASWALNNLERIVSFGHQAVHRTAVTAKAITSAYYERDPSRSLFFGCSRGGGQALMEAQRYPEDFDGIVAGAPAFSWTNELGGRNTWINQVMYPDPEDLATATISPEALGILGNAVLEQCDGLDGVEDGILNDPLACDFDPSVVACGTSGGGEACLTGAQVDAARRVYEGFRPNGELLWPGYPAGAEIGAAGWERWIAGGLSIEEVSEFQAGVSGDPDFPDPVTPNAHYAFGNGVMKYLVYHDPDWDYATYDFSTFGRDVAAVSQTLDATDPDLDAFRARRGKLLMFTGWRDMALTPLGTINYYESVLERDPASAEDVRLIMMPGMDHCIGGPGPSFVNWVEEIDQWLETDTPPTEVTAHWFDAQMQLQGSRLACAWPDVLEYDGTGDPRDAASFSCVTPDAAGD